MARNRIIDRLRKLLGLSRDRGASEHEAQLAAERAAELMAAHNIAEADLVAEVAEIKLDEGVLAEHGRRVSWEGQLAVGVAALVGGRHVWHYDNYRKGRRGRFATLKIVGTPDAVASAQYLFAAFRNTILQIADAEWTRRAAHYADQLGQVNIARHLAGKRPYGPDEWAAGVAKYQRKFKGSFRDGCAYRLAKRMEEAAAARRGQGASAHALVVLNQIKVKLDDRFKDVKKIRNGKVGDARGFHAGVAAADKIPLAADAGVIAAPPPQLTAGEEP